MATPDVARDILASRKIPESVKADAWDAFHASVTPDDLAARLKGMALLPNSVKAALWDAKTGKPANPEWFTDIPDAPEGSAVGRFLSNAGEMLNPVTIASGLATAVAHPVDALKGVLGQQFAQGRQALDQFRGGRISEGVGHSIASVVPLLGPIAAQAGEQIAAGDIAGGLGKATGLLAPLGAARAVRATGRIAKAAVPAGARAAIAGALEESAAAKMAKVIAPVTGRNKPELGVLARRVAPELTKAEGVRGLSRSGLTKAVGAKLENASAALDAATDAVPGTKMIPTTSIRQGIQAEIDALTTKGIRGEAFVPEPWQPRVAALQTMLDEVNKLGSMANYKAIRSLRQAWDSRAAQAKIYAQSAADFGAKAAGEAAADGASVMREVLAKAEPTVAKANAEWSLYRNAQKVLAATNEAEAARAMQFPRTAARAGGAIAGANSAGVPGAIGGALVSDVIEAAMRSGYTTKITTARTMARLATAIRTGNVGQMRALTRSLKSMVGLTATGRATTPSGSRTSTAPASAEGY